MVHSLYASSTLCCTCNIILSHINLERCQITTVVVHGKLFSLRCYFNTRFGFHLQNLKIQIIIDSTSEVCTFSDLINLSQIWVLQEADNKSY